MGHKRRHHIPDRPSATSSTSSAGSERLVHKSAASSSASGGPPSLPFSDPTTNSRAPESAQDRTRLRSNRSCTPGALGNIPSQSNAHSGNRIVHRSQRSLLSEEKAKMDGPARVQDEDDHDCTVDEDRKVTWASESETSDDLNDLWNRLSGRSYPKEHSVDFASDSSSDSDGRLQQVLSGKRIRLTQRGARRSADGNTDSASGEGTQRVYIPSTVPATGSQVSEDPLKASRPRHPRISASQDMRRAENGGGKRSRGVPKRPKESSLQVRRHRLLASSFDLAYGLLAHNISKQDDEWIDLSEGVVEAAVASFRSKAALEPDYRKSFSILTEGWGLPEPPSDEVTTKMIKCNNEILREQSQLAKGCKSTGPSVFLKRIVAQHTWTASYLLGPDLLNLDEQVRADIITLNEVCAQWEKTNEKRPARDTPLVDELCHGAGMRLRDRMWSRMGWQLTYAYNSRIVLDDEAVSAAIDACDPVEVFFQTAMDQAVIMLGTHIAENDVTAKTDKPGPNALSSSEIAKSLRLLKRYWNTFDWHEEGQRIALVRLNDMYGQKIRGLSNSTTISARRAASQDLKDERLEESMASQNLRVISTMARSRSPQGPDWKRIGIQSSLNAEYLLRRAIKQGELSETFNPAEMRASMKRLCDISTTNLRVAEVQGIITQSEEAKQLQDFVSLHLPKDWTLHATTDLSLT